MSKNRLPDRQEDLEAIPNTTETASRCQAGFPDTCGNPPTIIIRAFCPAGFRTAPLHPRHLAGIFLVLYSLPAVVGTCFHLVAPASSRPSVPSFSCSGGLAPPSPGRRATRPALHPPHRRAGARRGRGGIAKRFVDVTRLRRSRFFLLPSPALTGWARL